MKPFRIEKVGSEIRQIVSDAIHNRLQDPRIATLTSVTRVEVSGDLEWAKVHVSVLGEAREQRRTIEALQHAGGYIQKLLARALPIRQCPHLIFELDQSLKKGSEVLSLIEQAMRELDPDDPASESEDPSEASRPEPC